MVGFDEVEENILNDFQLRNIHILTHLLKLDAVSDDVVDLLREAELEYFSLYEKYRFLEKNVNIDEKTNLLKFKDDYLTNIVKTASRIFYGMKDVNYHVSFIRMDIDNFSTFNNQYGHSTGDDVLIKLAKTVQDNSRPTDYVIRYGGEEIDVILPSTDLEGAKVYLNKMYKKISEIRIPYEDKLLNVTISSGLSYLVYQFGEPKMLQDEIIDKNFKQLQREADNALYEAKFTGKNRYCLYEFKKKEEYKRIRKEYCRK